MTSRIVAIFLNFSCQDQSIERRLDIVTNVAANVVEHQLRYFISGGSRPRGMVFSNNLEDDPIQFVAAQLHGCPHFHKHGSAFLGGRYAAQPYPRGDEATLWNSQFQRVAAA
jgi:hypothetical protein